MWLIRHRRPRASIGRPARPVVAVFLAVTGSLTSSMRLTGLLVSIATLLAPGIAVAQDAAGARSGFTLGPTISTLGAGAEAGFRAGPYLGVRLDASFLSFDYNRSIDSIPYKFGVNLRSGGPVLDLYPFAGSFHLTAGARINGNGADVSATPGSNVTINGDTFTPAQVGTLTGSLKYNRVAPYLGIGYSGRPTRWLELGLDLGVLYQGKPSVNLAASGQFANNPSLAADIAQEETNVENRLGFTTWYPVVTFAALFHF